MAEPVAVRHDAAAHRYEAVVDGLRSVCEYADADGRRVFTHTYVPAELRGRGIAEQLVRAALADARAAGIRIVPACSYVARFVERHREYQDLLAGT